MGLVLVHELQRCLMASAASQKLTAFIIAGIEIGIGAAQGHGIRTVGKAQRAVSGDPIAVAVYARFPGISDNTLFLYSFYVPLCRAQCDCSEGA